MPTLVPILFQVLYFFFFFFFFLLLLLFIIIIVYFSMENGEHLAPAKFRIQKKQKEKSTRKNRIIKINLTPFFRCWQKRHYNIGM